MAQVLVTFSAVDRTRSVPAYSPAGVKSGELSTSGTAANTSVLADEGDYCRIVNAGEGVVWARVGVSAVAAVAADYAIPAGGVLDVGPCASGSRASVIDDS